MGKWDISKSSSMDTVFDTALMSEMVWQRSNVKKNPTFGCRENGFVWIEKWNLLFLLNHIVGA